jgi:hypothetical protein
MAENISNDAATTLDGSIDDTVTTVEVISSTGFPAANFRVRCDSELMLVTNVSGTTWTVTRAVEGTTAVGHGSGAQIAHVLTKGGIDKYLTSNFWAFENSISVAGEIVANNASGYGLRVTHAANLFTGIQIARTVNTPSSWDIYTPAGQTDIRMFANTADRFILTNLGALTITGGLSATTGTFSATGAAVGLSGATTLNRRIDISNTGGVLNVGVESSAGGAIVTGSTAYAGIINTSTATPVQIGSNSVLVASFASGAMTLTGTLAVSGNVTLGDTPGTDAHIVNGAFTINQSSNALLVKHASSGDIFKVFTNAAGTGIDLLSRNSADSAYAPLTLNGSSLTTNISATTISVVNSTGLGVFTSPGTELDVTKSKSGSTTQVRVRNSNSAAASDAMFLVSVEQATGGDPVVFYNINGVLNWAEGVDNSDSDKFKICGNTSALGTNDFLTIQTNGVVNIPVSAYIGISAGPASNALFTVISGGSGANGNGIEFGHPNSAGYRSTLGGQTNDGTPFLAFNAEAGTTANTYRTRGIKGSVFRSDLLGGWSWVSIPTATADNQSGSTVATLSAAGVMQIGGNTVWHAGNDGAGSGLDADLLDGFSSADFPRKAEAASIGGSWTFTVGQTFNGVINANGTGGNIRVRADGTDAKDGGVWADSGGVLRFGHWDGSGYYAVSASNVPQWNSTYTMWHAGNDGAGSTLDADLLDGMNTASSSATASTIVFRDANGDILGLARDAQTTRYVYAGANVNMGSSTENSGTGRIPTNTGADNWMRWTDLNYFKMEIGESYRNTYKRSSYSGDTNYWVGSMGGPGDDANTVFHYGSGHIDMWSGSNYPSGMTHIHGFQALHYSNGSTAYGIQVVGQYNMPGDLRIRTNNGGTFTSWYKVWTEATDGSGSGLDADLLDGLNPAGGGANVILRTDASGYIYLDAGFVRFNNGYGMFYNGNNSEFYHTSTDYVWRLRSAHSTACAILFMDSPGNTRGYAYGDSGGVGFLNSSASWRLQCPNAGGSLLRDGTYTMWDSGNDGSGSTLDADLTDGYHAAESATASTLAARNSSGYLFAVYLNQSSGDNENPTVSQFMVRNGSDTYLRAASLAHVKSALGVPTITESSYSPTVTAVLNSASPSAGTVWYQRVGDTVKVWGRFTIAAAGGNAAVQLAISLPVSSNLQNAEDLVGFAYRQMGLGAANNQDAQIIADTTNDRALVDYYAVDGDTTARLWYFSFTYKVR